MVYSKYRKFRLTNYVPHERIRAVAGFSTYDKEIIKRIEDIDQLDEDTKKHLFFLVDNVIQNYKTKKAFDK